MVSHSPEVFHPSIFRPAFSQRDCLTPRVCNEWKKNEKSRPYSSIKEKNSLSFTVMVESGWPNPNNYKNLKVRWLSPSRFRIIEGTEHHNSGKTITLLTKKFNQIVVLEGILKFIKVDTFVL